MKNIYALLLVIALSACAFGQTSGTKFTVTGLTTQTEGKARLLLYNSKSQFVAFDSTEIKNGKFVFSGMLDEPKSFQLQIRNKSRILFIGNENIVVTEKNNEKGEITVAGSKLSNDYDYYFERWIAPLMVRLEEINQRMEALDKTQQQEMDSLTALQGSLFNHVSDSSAVFIKENPSSFVSLYLLNYYSEAYSIDEMKMLFNRLDNKLKHYPSANLMKEKILNRSGQSQFIEKAARPLEDRNFDAVLVSLDNTTAAG